MTITTEIIDNTQELTLTLQELNSTKNKALSVELCTSVNWLISWLSYYPTKQDKLFVCCHRIGAKFIALYPLYLKKNTFGYELRFIGTGEPEYAEVCSEFQDFIIHPDYHQESLSLFTEQVKRLKQCYRICFDIILPQSYCYQWIKNQYIKGWVCQDKVVGQHFLVPIASSDQQQIEQLQQSTLRRYARRFVDRNDIAVEYCLKEEDISCFFETLIKLHTAQWQKRGKPGAFVSLQFRQFHTDFAKSMLTHNKLLLFKLTHANHVIAVFYGFYHGTTLYYYQSGISAKSPLPNTGVAMHLIAMRHAREQHMAHYDLMKGSSHSYKQQYVTAAAQVRSVSQSIFWIDLTQKLIKVPLFPAIKHFLRSIRAYLRTHS